MIEKQKKLIKNLLIYLKNKIKMRKKVGKTKRKQLTKIKKLLL